jgi:adenylate cyclase
MRQVFISAILLFTLSASPVFAQLHGQAKIDSLLTELPHQKEDTNKVNLLIDIGSLFLGTAPDTSMKFAGQAQILATKLDYKKGIGYALKQQGIVYYNNGDYVNALQKWEGASAIFESAGFKKGIANIQSNIGALYFEKGNYVTAQQYYLKGLKIAEEIGDTLRITTLLINIGANCVKSDALTYQALGYYRRALALAYITGDNNAIGTSLVNIATNLIHPTSGSREDDSTHLSYDKDPATLVRYDSCIFYLQKACELYEGSDNLSYALTQLGHVYMHKSVFDSSIMYSQKAYEAAIAMKSQSDAFAALSELATVKAKMNDHKSAIDYCYKAINLASKYGSFDNFYKLRKIFSRLSTSYAAINRYDSAYKYSELSAEMSKKTQNIELSKKLEKELFGFEINKQQGEINLQHEVINRQTLVRNVLIGGFCLMMLFAGIFFSQRNKIKAGKKQSDELLLNILPAEVAEELKAKGSAEAKLIDDVTVLFTDFKGFTQLSEKLSPKELVGEINTCFSAFDNIMQKHGVEKIKTIGDAYMAAGGLPTPNKTHAEDVVKAALEIQSFMANHKQQRETEGKLFFEIRIGVHTGPVVAGIVGIKKFAYDIWGDTVNTASRMESSGSVGMVNISETTYNLVKDKFPCEYRGEVEAKGKGVMKMYFVG